MLAQNLTHHGLKIQKFPLFLAGFFCTNVIGLWHTLAQSLGTIALLYTKAYRKEDTYHANCFIECDLIKTFRQTTLRDFLNAC